MFWHSSTGGLTEWGSRRSGQRSPIRDLRSAVDVLESSQQFKRDLDNSTYHSGYPSAIEPRAVSPPFRPPSRSIGGTATSTSTIDRQCSRRPWDSRHESLVLTRV